MSLELDIENLPYLSDEDRDVLEDQYTVIPALMSDEAIARRDTDAVAEAKMQALTDSELAQIFHVHGELEYVDSLAAVLANSLCADEEHNHELIQLQLMRRMLWTSRDVLGALVGLPGDAKEVSHD